MLQEAVRINALEGYRDFDGYEITPDGNVYSYHIRGMNKKYTSIDWSLKPTKLSSVKKSNGYIHLGISDVHGNKKYPTIHRLLALAFIPNPHYKKIVNHINGNKSDNRLENLEWVSHRENSAHAYETGLSSNAHKSKPVDRLDLYGNYIDSFQSISEATVSVGLKPTSKGSITKVCRGRQKSSAGYMWRYSEIINDEGSTTISKESTP